MTLRRRRKGPDSTLGSKISARAPWRQARPALPPMQEMVTTGFAQAAIEAAIAATARALQAPQPAPAPPWSEAAATRCAAM